MSKSNRYLSALLATVALFGVSAASASDGTVVISGQVDAQTCTLTDGANGTYSVTLPKVNTNAINHANEGVYTPAGMTRFTMSVTGCAANSTVQAYFEPTAAVDIQKNVLKNTAATYNGVDVALYDTTTQKITFADYASNYQGNTVFETDESGNSIMDFYAAYESSLHNATPGAVTASVNFTLIYP